MSAYGNGDTHQAAYGDPSSSESGSTSSCLNPPPAPFDVTASITPGTGSSKYDVELSWGLLSGAASFRVERSDDGGATWPHVTTGIARAPHPVADLPCDQDYRFRVSALGDGKRYQAVYGPATVVDQYTPIDTRSARSSGGFRCTKPDVSVIPLPERKVKLSWNALGTGSTYKVQAIKYDGSNSINAMSSEIRGGEIRTARLNSTISSAVRDWPNWLQVTLAFWSA